MNREKYRKINGLPALVFWTVTWHIAAAALDNGLLLPGPVQVLQCLVRLAATAAFWQTVLVSLGRILLGVVWAVALGLILAVVAFRWRLVETLLEPAMTAVRATPVASFAILVLIWLDRDWVPVLICGLMVLPVIYGSVSGGLRTVDGQLLEMGKAYGFSSYKIMRYIYAPSVKPAFVSACMTGLGFAWKSGIAAEVIALPVFSVGTNLYNAKIYLESADLFAWTFTVILLSIALEALLRRF